MANPSLDAIEGLAKALGVDAIVFFEIVEPTTPYEGTEVPFASDDTCFHPGLASPRDGSFRVGEKNAERRFSTFEEALAYLRSMPIARWRRPNNAGNSGLVSAVRWGKPPSRKLK
jgi:hypothetical protein